MSDLGTIAKSVSDVLAFSTFDGTVLADDCRLQADFRRSRYDDYLFRRGI
jgi:hypothetical protein